MLTLIQRLPPTGALARERGRGLTMGEHLLALNAELTHQLLRVTLKANGARAPKPLELRKALQTGEPKTGGITRAGIRAALMAGSS